MKPFARVTQNTDPLLNSGDKQDQIGIVIGSMGRNILTQHQIVRMRFADHSIRDFDEADLTFLDTFEVLHVQVFVLEAPDRTAFLLAQNLEEANRVAQDYAQELTRLYNKPMQVTWYALSAAGSLLEAHNTFRADLPIDKDEPTQKISYKVQILEILENGDVLWTDPYSCPVTVSSLSEAQEFAKKKLTLYNGSRVEKDSTLYADVYSIVESRVARFTPELLSVTV